jgi:predicted flap endonuclease-1-like 5' DNA nuclease
VIYLISQMLFALALAGILGAAIGWLVHRAAHARRLDNSQHALARAQNQVAQTESEVSMLSDDYDELRSRSKAEINALRHETQQIPALSTNLERSQLLVRQLMQKHESKVRDLSAENSALSAKLKSITDREQAYDKVKVELDNIRRQKMEENRQQISEDHDEQASSDSKSSVLDTDDSTVGTGDLNFDDSIDAIDHNESIVDEQSEVLDATIVSGPADDFIKQLNEATRLPISDARSSGSWASAPLIIDADCNDSETLKVSDQVETDAAEEPEASEEVILAEEDDSDDPFDSVMEVGDELQRELDIDADAAAFADPVGDPLLDGSSDNVSLFEFEPVDHQDDLKQIFGIGPVTEKALNELGITSYSQLADLKSHEVEKIADALSIIPGRIERDDWVGNARRQLEDVLEEL